VLRPAAARSEENGCDLYASPSGSDTAPGTSSAPLLTPQRLVESLSRGQVGCFMAGTYDSSGEGIKVSTAGITLTSAPGGRATVIGRWWIARGADDVTISHLDIDGRNDAGQVGGPVVNAANTRFEDVDVTNDHTTICFVIEHSRIHDCGTLPANNHEHGIYVEDSRNVVVHGNWIYDNADRGIQLYPQAIGTHIYGNVIDGNGEGVIFSGSGEQASSENVVEDNVISNATIRWNAESYWGASVVGSGNVVRDNCVWGSNEDTYFNQEGGVEPPSAGAKGFIASENVRAEPRFVDRAGGDFTQQPDSPCAFIEGGGTEGGTEASETREATEASETSTESGTEGSTETGVGPGKVKIRKHQKAVSASVPLLLTGHAEGGGGTTVTVLMRRRGGWHRFARRRLRPDGSFEVRKRLRGRRGTARLRAMVPGLGFSRVVKVRVRPARPPAGDSS
jgi:parallel beta-helix repeat protein